MALASGKRQFDLDTVQEEGEVTGDKNEDFLMEVQAPRLEIKSDINALEAGTSVSAERESTDETKVAVGKDAGQGSAVIEEGTKSLREPERDAVELAATSKNAHEMANFISEIFVPREVSLLQKALAESGYTVPRDLLEASWEDIDEDLRESDVPLKKNHYRKLSQGVPALVNIVSKKQFEHL